MINYTKIKELIFKLLKEVYPEAFVYNEAKYGDIRIAWSSAGYSNIDSIPFNLYESKCVPLVSFWEKGMITSINIPLTKKEFLELQLILEEKYPAWLQWRVDDIEKTLTNLVTPTNFELAQERVLNDD